MVPESAPEQKRASLIKLLPAPVSAVAKWRGPVLQCGSDDLLEAHVQSAYGPGLPPPSGAFHDEEEERPRLPDEDAWRAFSDDFRDAMGVMHERHPLFAVLKPGSGAYGLAHSEWHERSLERCVALAERGLSEGFEPEFQGYIAINLLIAKLPRGTDRAAPLAPEAREVFVRWLDWLIPQSRRSVARALAEKLGMLLGDDPGPFELSEATLVAVESVRPQLV